MPSPTPPTTQTTTPTTWFITGTSSGLGRCLTERLLARGDRVAATVRDPAALDDLAARYGDRLWVASLDVTDAGAVRTVVDRAFADLGRVDVVVSNAGYGLFGAAEELDDAAVQRQVDTNLVGSIALIRASLPHLRAQGGGRVVQISSEGGQRTYPGFSAYHATKWGVEGFVEAVAQEVAPFGITCLLAELGPTRTQFGVNAERADPHPAYDATPVGDMRRRLATGAWTFADLGKATDAIIAAAEDANAPLRLTLGSTAHTSVTTALRSRLAMLEPQAASAAALDAAELDAAEHPDAAAARPTAAHSVRPYARPREGGPHAPGARPH
jgi:NAD(P)-dependent dehydrogenase (short-subunit alcohol dehydrogenase family)